MWTRVDVAWLSFHITNWIMTFCSEEMREFHAGVFGVKTPLLGSVQTKKTSRLLECVYSCIEDSECRSVSYSRTVCHLHSSPVTVARDLTSTILYANVREENEPSDNFTTKAVWEPTAVLKKGKMSWREAERQCWDIGHLITIDSDAKQATAKKLVDNSGLEYVAIGVYKRNFEWVLLNTQVISYAAWDGGKPDLFGFFVALSRRSGYKWEAINHHVNGRICEPN